MKKIVKKVPNNSTGKSSKSQQRRLDFTKDFRIGFVRDRRAMLRNDALEFLAELMKEWIKSSPNLFFIYEFYNMQNVLSREFNVWSKRCPKLAVAKEIAFQTIAFNRERGALRASPDGVAFRHMQGYYDGTWKRQEDRQAELKSKLIADANKKGDVTIVLPSVKELTSGEPSERRAKDNTK